MVYMVYRVTEILRFSFQNGEGVPYELHIVIIPLAEVMSMVYQINQELPEEIRHRLSERAQSFYRAAFNSAMQWYGQEEQAHRIAWSAVRSQIVSLNSAIE
jgi:cation transport regulator